MYSADRSQDKSIAAAAAYRDWADADADCRWCFRRCGYRRDCPQSDEEEIKENKDIVVVDKALQDLSKKRQEFHNKRRNVVS